MKALIVQCCVGCCTNWFIYFPNPPFKGFHKAVRYVMKRLAKVSSYHRLYTAFHR